MAAVQDLRRTRAIRANIVALATSFSRIIDEDNLDPYPGLMDKTFVMNNTPTALMRLIPN